MLCGKILATLGRLDAVVSGVKRTSNDPSGGGPTKFKWLVHRPTIHRLQTELVSLTGSLGIALQILQGIHGNIKIGLLLARIQVLAEDLAVPTIYRDNVLDFDLQLQRLAVEPMNNIQAPESETVPSVQMQLDSPSSSRWPSRNDTIELAVSQKKSLIHQLAEKDSTATPRVSPSGTLVDDSSCESFCQCQCHTGTRVRTPRWTDALIGSFVFNGNDSIILRSRPCNLKQCKGPRPLCVQISYAAPSWIFLNNMVFYLQAR